MSETEVITQLPDTLGYMLYYMVQFIGNIFSGWILFLSLLTLGFIIVIYFKFFADITRYNGESKH